MLTKRRAPKRFELALPESSFLPLGFAAGDTNLYRYARNNPTDATDPSGLQLYVIGEDTKTIVMGLLKDDLQMAGPGSDPQPQVFDSGPPIIYRIDLGNNFMNAEMRADRSEAWKDQAAKLKTTPHAILSKMFEAIGSGTINYTVSMTQMPGSNVYHNLGGGLAALWYARNAPGPCRPGSCCPGTTHTTTAPSPYRKSKARSVTNRCKW